MEIGTKAANALERVHGTKFVVGPISTTICMYICMYKFMNLGILNELWMQVGATT